MRKKPYYEGNGALEHTAQRGYSLLLQGYSKNTWVRSYWTCSGEPALAGEVDQMISRDPIQLQPFCNSLCCSLEIRSKAPNNMCKHMFGSWNSILWWWSFDGQMVRGMYLCTAKVRCQDVLSMALVLQVWLVLAMPEDNFTERATGRQTGYKIGQVKGWLLWS